MAAEPEVAMDRAVRGEEHCAPDRLELPHVAFSPTTPWSDAAIAGTTPALPGLFALATLWAVILKHGWQPRCVAWYAKSHPTVSDALTSGRQIVEHQF